MQCITCKKEFKSQRKTAKFCSARCRKLAFHSKQVSVPRNEEGTLKTAQELYDAIDRYEGDTWASSPEYAELKRRLKKNSVEQLKKENFWIPAWKLHAQII